MATPSAVDPGELRAWANQTESMLSTLVEAGLCSNAEAEEQVRGSIAKIEKARERLSESRFAAAATALSEADILLHKAFAAQSRRFRWPKLLPLVFLYLYAGFLVLLLLATEWRPAALDTVPSLDEAELWGIPVRVLVFGALGATLRSLFWIHQQVARRTYRAYFTVTHLATPVIGALFGIFVYLLLTAGLFTLEGSNEGEISNEMLPFALAFLAGFNWETVLDWLSKLSIRSREPSPSPPPEKIEPDSGAGRSTADEAKNREPEKESSTSEKAATPLANEAKVEESPSSTSPEPPQIEDPPAGDLVENGIESAEERRL